MTAPSPHELVTEFHETYGMPIRPTTEPTVDFERVHMRYNLIAEEFVELTEALYGAHAARKVSDEITIQTTEGIVEHQEGYTPLPLDTVEAADALADLVYVIYGFALEAGIDLDAVLAEVQRSNLSKLGEDGKPIYRNDGKVLKGPGFSPPDLLSVLFPTTKEA